MEKLIVYGANGRTGRPIVEKALAAGHTVTAAVRNPDAFNDFVNASPHQSRLTVARVDVLDAKSTAASAVGHTAAMSAVGASRKTNHLFERSGRHLVDALAAAGVKNVQFISSGAVEERDPSLPFIYGRIISPLFFKETYADIRKLESIVRASDLDWTLIRPGYLNNKPGRGRWRVEDKTTPKRGWQISREDVAAFMVEQISSPTWVHRFPTLNW